MGTSGRLRGALCGLAALLVLDNWDKVVPPALQQFSKCKGKWIAAPVSFHSTNWIWATKAVLDAAGKKPGADFLCFR